MAVFFIYVHDGGTYSMEDMEYSPNTEQVKRELARRVRTGKGRTTLIASMDEISPDVVSSSRTEEEWPPATDDALMAVWRSRTNTEPTGPPTEVWLYSGVVDQPRIIKSGHFAVPNRRPFTPRRRIGVGDPGRELGDSKPVNGVYRAFGLRLTMTEWCKITGLSASTLRLGAKNYGMQEYLRLKQWSPDGRLG